VDTAAYIRNCVTTTSTGQTPYERWYGIIPDVSHMRVFGCTAYAHIPEADRKKLDKKSNKLKFLEYGESQKGYRLLDMAKQKLIISRDVIFNEADFGQQKEQGRYSQMQKTKPSSHQRYYQRILLQSKVSSQNLIGQQESRKVRSQRIMALMSMQMSQR